MALPRPTSPQPTPPKPTLWHNRSFTAWLAAATQSRFGSALSGVALSFLVLEETGDAGALSLTLALAFLPALLMPLAGAWIDRLPPKWPLVVSDLLSGAVQLALGGAALAGVLSAHWLYAAALLGGLVGAVSIPATQSAVPRLVAPGDLAQANGLMSSFRQAALLAGFAAGGALVAKLGAPTALLLDGASYLLSALAVGALVTFPPTKGPVAGKVPRRLWAELQEGLGALLATPALQIIPMLFLVSNAVYAPLQVLVPAEMQRSGFGAGGYSGFLMAEMLGGLGAGALFAWKGGQYPARWSVAAGLCLTATGFCLLAAAHGLPTYLLGAACVGLGSSVTGIPLQTLVGQQVPQPYLGRVFSLLGTVSMAGIPLALLLVTPLVGGSTDSVPVTWLYGVAAGTLLGLAVAWWWAAREL